MMECINEYQKIKEKFKIGNSPAEWRNALENFIVLLAPFAPHISEEIWKDLGFRKSIFNSDWPSYDEKLIEEEVVTIVIQINGKIRGEIVVEKDASEAKVREESMKIEKIKSYIEGKKIKKVIYVKGRLLSIVIT